MERAYALSHYDVSPMSVEEQNSYLNELSLCCYSDESAGELKLASEALEMENQLHKDFGVNKFVFKRDLDRYLAKNDEVVLRKSKDYVRFIPPQIAEAIVAVEAQDNGETYILSFADERNELEYQAVHPLLANQQRQESLAPPTTEARFTLIEGVESKPKPVDPIAFGALRSADGKLYDKLWILGAWNNNYPSLSTSETIIASLTHRGSISDLRIEES